jgi:hypothetical protein
VHPDTSDQRLLIRLMYPHVQDDWVFGLFPSFGILRNTKEHNVSGTGSVSVLRWVGGEDTYSVGSVRKSQPPVL